MGTRSAPHGFGFVSAAERRNADLFLVDLLGISRVRPLESESYLASLTEDVPVSLQMRSGGIIGNSSSATNVKEDVLHALDRLHTLWSITSDNYAREYPRVSAMPAGTRISNPDVNLLHTLAAIRQNQGAHLHHEVMRNFLDIDVGAPVGDGQPNRTADVRKLQTVLVALELLAEPALTEGTPVGSSVPARNMPATLAAIRELKKRIAGGRLGWDPIHADELESGGDRFGGRTYHWNNLGVDLGIFVPRGTSPDRSDVHVFFSPGDAHGDSGLNAVLHHGLRAACEGTGWILIGIPGKEPGFHTTSTAQIEGALRRVGRSTNVARLRLSGHSRGARGLRETIKGRLIDIAKIDRVVILDAGWQSVANVLAAARIPKSKVVSYQVTDATVPPAVGRTVRIAPHCARAIGYSRLIQDAMHTRRSLVIPKEVRDQLLKLPSRGQLTAATTASGLAKDIGRFCAEPLTSKAIASIIKNESTTPHGLRTFLEANDLGRLGSRFDTTTYSHHFFVCEIAHELTK
jgi:hypothetical protein